MSNENNITNDQVDISYALLLNIHAFLKQVAEFIQQQQGKYDPLAIKLLNTAKELGTLTETDVIQILYFAKQMNKEKTPKQI